MVYLLTIFTLFFSFHSFAYLDPGTGSYILQIIVGALAGSIFIIKTYWGRIKLFLSKKNAQTEEIDKDE